MLRRSIQVNYVWSGKIATSWQIDGRVLHRNAEGRDVSVEILGYAAPPKGTMVVSWVEDDKDEYFGVYASRTDSYRGHTREGTYGVLLVVDGLVDCPWKVIA